MHRPYTRMSLDPRWITAKYSGKTRDGAPFNRGDTILYFPADKSICVGEKAEQEWRNFQSIAADEYLYNVGS